jgi:hypothetical protein
VKSLNISEGKKTPSPTVKKNLILNENTNPEHNEVGGALGFKGL